MTKPMTTSKPSIIATHNGTHHADDVFGVAVLQMLYPNSEVLRTRDQATIDAADYAVDVGGSWDAGRGRFDHHQRGFSGARASGVVYASAGLVWECFGVLCIAAVVQANWPDAFLTGAQYERIAKSIDDELVQHLDQADTGAAQGAPGLFGLSALLSQFNPTWLDEKGLTPEKREALKLASFVAATQCMRRLLVGIIADKAAECAAETLIRKSATLAEGKILVLNNGGLPWTNIVSLEMKEVLFVIYPDSSDNQYQVRTVPVEPESFIARADLPSAWAGLRDKDLAAVTGVADAAFCHNACFIGGAYSYEGAVAMALLGLEQVAK